MMQSPNINLVYLIIINACVTLSVCVFVYFFTTDLANMDIYVDICIKHMDIYIHGHNYMSCNIMNSFYLHRFMSKFESPYARSNILTL